MDYKKDILNKLLDKYEKRGAYDKKKENLRIINIEVSKEYKEYENRYNDNEYLYINNAIERLLEEKFVDANKDDRGYYKKIKLNIDKIDECYKKLKRENIPEQCDKILDVLKNFEDNESPIIKQIISSFKDKMIKHQKLPYDLKYDRNKIMEILSILEAVLKLDTETYVRNFSTYLFNDSKRFQREFRGTIERILYDYTDSIVQKDKILEFYNLYENPTYVYIKGDIQITFDTSVINVREMPDGIAFSSASLEKINNTKVNVHKIITVENLTTYHDLDDKDAIYIYLGGYHNKAKQKLLEMIYKSNKKCKYYHTGDIDVYGFLILENLKIKTNIPFEPLMMDKKTLEKFFKLGLYKELTSSDEKKIKENKDTKLAMYNEELEFMLKNNCKVEQESIKALELNNGENIKK